MDFNRNLRLLILLLAVALFAAAAQQGVAERGLPTAAEINGVMKEAAEGALKGILQYTDEPLVSTDLRGNDHSSIFSAVDTVALGNLVKVVSWYDNEWGYSCRLADLCNYVAEKGV